MNTLNFIFLTRSTSNLPLIGPIWNVIVSILGFIMNWIYVFLENISIPNIGLAIILFTLITRVVMFPSSIGQQKSQRMMRLLQPEMKAIEEKYKNKTDNASLMAKQTEMRALYERYGTSMTAGCLPLLIQMPIIFALYQIIIHIPAYVPSVYAIYESVVNELGTDQAAVQSLIDFSNNNGLGSLLSQVSNFGLNDGVFVAENTANYMVDFLYKLNPDQWSALSAAFPSASAVIDTAATQSASINSFLGLNLSTAPSAYGLSPNRYWLIPIAAAFSQWLSAFLMQRQNQASQGNDQSAQMMKSMNIMMPLMSLWFTFSFASGIGLYWIASSLFMVVQQTIMNWYFGRKTDKEMLSEAMEKANKKREKKGLPPIDEKSVEKQIQSMQNKQSAVEQKRMEQIAKQEVRTKEASEYYNQDAKPGSLASKAMMVKKYNEKHEKKK